MDVAVTFGIASITYWVSPDVGSSSVNRFGLKRSTSVVKERACATFIDVGCLPSRIVPRQRRTASCPCV